MPVTSAVTNTDDLTLTLTADVDAPAPRLWRAFTEPRQLERFWGPPGWPATFTQFDFRVGGTARYHMTSPEGERFYAGWTFEAIDEGASFEVEDSFLDADGNAVDGMPVSRASFDFVATPTGARLVAITRFGSLASLEQSLQMGMVEGSTLAFNQLDSVVHDLREFAEGKGTRTELVDDTHVRITRVINGPRDLVWRAHHEPELLKRWLLGPDGWVMVEAEVALHAGDRHRSVWRKESGDEESFGFEGEALLVEAPVRAVTTERMIGTDGPSTRNDLSLYEEDGVTLLTLLIEYPDRATRDAVLATGMTDGMEASYARLERDVLH